MADKQDGQQPEMSGFMKGLLGVSTLQALDNEIGTANRKRQVLEMLLGRPDIDPDTYKEVIKGFTASSLKPSAKGAKGKLLGKKEGQSPLDEIFQKLMAMPTFRKPGGAQTTSTVSPQQRQQQPQQAGTQLPPMPQRGKGPQELPLETPGAKASVETKTTPETPGLFKAPGEAGTLPERRESRLEEAQKFKETATGRMTDVQLADRGLMRDPQGQVVPASPEQWSPAFKQKMDNEAALVQLRESQKALDAARAELERAKSNPSSDAYKAAQAKLAAETERNNIAREHLGLSKRRQALSEEQQAFKETGPTTAVRTSAQTAQVILPELQTARQEIQTIGDELGPGIGRLNDALRHIGNPPPEYQRLASRLELIASGLSKFHAARGVAAIKRFMDLVDTGKMTPEALDASLDAIGDFLNGYIKQGEYAPSKGKGKRSPVSEPPNRKKVVKYEDLPE